MSQINKWYKYIEIFLFAIACWTTFFMMILIFISVISRFLFNSAIIGVFEFTGEYILVVIVFLSLSNTHRIGEHVSVELIREKAPKIVKDVLDFISNILSMTVFIVVGFFNLNHGLDYFSQNIKSAGLIAYPLWPAIMIITLGVFLISGRLLLNSVNMFNNNN